MVFVVGLKKMAIAGALFASARRDHANGYPPNSADCMLLDAAAVFDRFEVLFSEDCPKSIPETIRVATAIVKELSDHRWVEHLDQTYQEIIV
jgi:hypothetical protein